MISKIKGTRDILDLSLLNFFLKNIKKQLGLYDFTEIITPIIEPIELFKRCLGDFTDVVTKEMYTINTGQSEEIICLRPEGTASIVRAFIEAGNILKPWKVFTWGPMFRHERPQKGRYRQFYQLTAEIIGTEAVNQDVQFIKMLDRHFTHDLGLDLYSLFINFLGCKEDREKYKQKLYSRLPENLCNTCIERKEKNIMRIFDCKNQSCQKIYQSMPHIADNLCESCSSEWKELKNNLELLSIKYSYNPMLVRGLDYYEKTVFEFSSLDLGSQNAFCGGGRYKLGIKLGHKEEIPSLGAGIGIDRVLLLLEQIQDRIILPKAPALHVIIPLDCDKEQESLALLIADELQAYDLKTDIILEKGSIKSKMRKADKMNARFVLLIGSEEQKNNFITVKDMLLKTERTIKKSSIVSYFREKQDNIII